MSEAVDHVRAVVLSSMSMVRDVMLREPSTDALDSITAIEEDGERAIVLLTAARDRLQCVNHFLADKCPPDCIEGQLATAIDAFLVTHVLPQPRDATEALGLAIELATSGHQVTIGTDGSVAAAEVET